MRRPARACSAARAVAARACWTAPIERPASTLDGFRSPIAKRHPEVEDRLVVPDLVPSISGVIADHLCWIGPGERKFERRRPWRSSHSTAEANSRFDRTSASSRRAACWPLGHRDRASGPPSVDRDCCSSWRCRSQLRAVVTETALDSTGFAWRQDREPGAKPPAPLPARRSSLHRHDAPTCRHPRVNVIQPPLE